MLREVQSIPLKAEGSGLRALKINRELSSAGSEHLPYKQRVGGSNPSAPTKSLRNLGLFLLLDVHVI
jgi:hypothetical protein